MMRTFLSRGVRATSLAHAIILSLFCLWIAYQLHENLPRFIVMYRACGITTPWYTRLLFEAHGCQLWASFAILAVMILAKERYLADRRAADRINGICFVSAVAFTAACAVCLFEPLINVPISTLGPVRP